MRYLKFDLRSYSPSQESYYVRKIESNHIIGFIEWDEIRKEYCFFSWSDYITIYEAYLKEILKFVSRMNLEYRLCNISTRQGLKKKA